MLRLLASAILTLGTAVTASAEPANARRTAPDAAPVASTESPKRAAKTGTAKNAEADKNAGAAKKRPPFRWVNRPKKALPAGVEHHTFESAIAGEPVGYLIHLPPGYAESARRYPVVYYLHGGRPGSEAKSLGIVPFLEEHQQSGAAASRITVLVNGGPVSHYNTPAVPAIRQTQTRGADVFITELIPHIDATYRTLADRGHRNLEGFSQGGRGTARLAFRHPGLFGAAAAGGGGYATELRISQSEGYEHPRLKFAGGDNAYDLAAAYAGQRATGSAPPLRLLVYVGTKGFNYQNNLAFLARLNELDVPHEQLIVPDVPHSGRQIYERRGLEIMQWHAAGWD